MILGLALCAVVAGARSFTAIAEWAADADEQTLRMPGITGAVPSESTFRRTLRRLDKVTAVAAGLAFPDAAQAIQIIRRRRRGRKKKGPARPSTPSPR